MSHSVYKNKKLLKELSEKDYRLLKFNKVLNPFHTYLMYSLIPSELNELNLKDLNSVVEIFKKNINKFVKKKFNKNYVNANAQKDLDIFAELCHLNISIFNNNFNNLHSSTKNKKYTKRLYLINRDNDLFLLIKKNKKGLKLKLGNNVLKPIQSGGGEPAAKKARTTLAPMFRDNYYNPNSVNDFLRTYCKKLIKKGERTDALTKEMEGLVKNTPEYKKKKKEKGELNKQKLEHFKEIIIAAFTDHMRDVILLLIKNIETDINNRMYEAGIEGDINFTSLEKPVRIVISGGSGFNNLISINDRPISPDIDVKLCLHTQEAIALHNHMTQNKNVNQNVNMNQNVNDEDIKNLQMVVAKQLLIVRTHLFNVMKDEAEIFSKDIIKPLVEDFNNMFQKLYQHCKTLMVEEMAGKDIPFLKSLDLNENEDVEGIWKKEFNETVKVLVRETLMKRGIDGEPEENNPYKLHDVFLYSLDLPFNRKTGFESLAGILDIVVSIPGHIGYILPDYSTNTSSVFESNILGCYNITKDYYKYELIKLITYGLRTTNKKILKDLERYKILLKLDKNRPGPTIIEVQDINKVIEGIDNETLKSELRKLLGDAISVGLNSPSQSSQLSQPSQSSQSSPKLSPRLAELELLRLIEENKLLVVIKSDTQDSDDHLENIYEDDHLKNIDEEYNQDGGSKKKKQIGGAPNGNVEMLSLSKVFQLMVNNISMGDDIILNDPEKKKKINDIILNDPEKKKKKKINFELDKNDDFFNNIKLVHDKIKLVHDKKVHVPPVNFEKLTELEVTNEDINVHIHVQDPYVQDEYLSTKATTRVVPFRMSEDARAEIIPICDHLKDVIYKGYINRLCYCYESDDYKPEPENPNVPSEQEYAAFLLTQCQVLNTIDVTKRLYRVIEGIAKTQNERGSRVRPS